MSGKDDDILRSEEGRGVCVRLANDKRDSVGKYILNQYNGVDCGHPSSCRWKIVAPAPVIAFERQLLMLQRDVTLLTRLATYDDLRATTLSNGHAAAYDRLQQLAGPVKLLEETLDDLDYHATSILEGFESRNIFAHYDSHARKSRSMSEWSSNPHLAVKSPGEALNIADKKLLGDRIAELKIERLDRLETMVESLRFELGKTNLHPAPSEVASESRSLLSTRRFIREALIPAIAIHIDNMGLMLTQLEHHLEDRDVDTSPVEFARVTHVQAAAVDSRYAAAHDKNGIVNLAQARQLRDQQGHGR